MTLWKRNPNLSRSEQQRHLHIGETVLLRLLRPVLDEAIRHRLGRQATSSTINLQRLVLTWMAVLKNPFRRKLSSNWIRKRRLSSISLIGYIEPGKIML